MEKKDLYKLTDEELLDLKKKLKKSKVFHAVYIGFLAGILIFGVVSWSLSSEKHFGFLIPMLIPVAFIYILLKNPNKNKALEEVLKERDLN
jgi:asparagine N-glycosylation enzyme membrane subunit Stt3